MAMVEKTTVRTHLISTLHVYKNLISCSHSLPVEFLYAMKLKVLKFVCNLLNTFALYLLVISCS